MIRVNISILVNYSKYKFKCLLTKDASETCSLEYITIITNYTVSFFYYTDICFCVLTD